MSERIAGMQDSRVGTQDSGAGAHDPRAEAQDSGLVRRPDTHELLLELAGRLDDDLLAWARELVAVGEEGQAVELVSAALAAERVALPPAVRAAVVAASRAAYTDLDADAELAPAVPDDAVGHRFAAAGSGERVAAVLAALPARRLAGCTLHLTWRLTPAGAAPGPVPRAVVLVETDPDRSAEVLAYLLATELDRAGLPASVEVFTAGGVLPAYHRAARRSARRIEVGAPVTAPAGVVVARTAAEAAHAERSAPVGAGPADTAALFAVSSGGDDGTQPGEPRRAGRRRKREPAAEVPATVRDDGAPGDRLDDAPDTDPFHGPLRVPLLAPLLEPTTPGTDGADDGDRPAVPTPIRPVPAQPADEPGAPAGAEPDDDPSAPGMDGAEPVTAGEPQVPEVPDDVPQEWEDDWRSGDWAMPPTARPSTAGHPTAGPPTAVPQPSPDQPAFDVFERPAPPVEGNAAERTARTELPSRPTPDHPELPSRTASARPDPDPDPTAAGPELPFRAAEGRGPERSGARPALEPFRTHRAEIDAGGTAALPSRAGRDRAGPVAHPGPAEERPADVSLFDSPTGRVGSPARPASPRPMTPPEPPPAAASDVPLFDEPQRDDHRPAGPPEPARPGRRRRPDADDVEPGPSTAEVEPSLLSSTERDLLAQLQAELADRERHPRPYRRARTAVTPVVNGHGVNGHGVNGHAADGDRPADPGATASGPD